MEQRIEIMEIISSNYERFLNHARYRSLRGQEQHDIYSAEDIVHLAIENFLNGIDKMDNIDQEFLEGYVIKGVMNNCDNGCNTIRRIKGIRERDRDVIKSKILNQVNLPIESLLAVEERNMRDALPEDVLSVIVEIERLEGGVAWTRKNPGVRFKYRERLAEVLGIKVRALDELIRSGSLKRHVKGSLEDVGQDEICEPCARRDIL